MQTVECISERNELNILKIGQQYKVDLSTAHGDTDGDWYAVFYDMNGERLGYFNLKHFKTIE